MSDLPNLFFYISAIVALVATFMVVTRKNPVHALLYLVVSFLALALVFFALGAPFVAALEVVVYAGAIVVLFIFVVMLLNLGEETVKQETAWLKPGAWAGPSILALILLGEVVYALLGGGAMTPATMTSPEVSPKAVSLSLFGPYLVGVQLAAFLLLAGLVGAFHLGRKEGRE